MMRHLTRGLAAFMVGMLILGTPRQGFSEDQPKDRPAGPAEPPRATATENVPEVNLLEAIKSGQVTVKAEGIGDGRITLSLTNKSHGKLRVVLPPGIVAQGATGQFGGMGGMGGGMMGGMGGMMGGMGGGGMMGGMGGGMMGGMGGGMGMMGGGGGGMMGMGGMGRQAGTMPPTMGMMMLSRMIMYFCGDPDSWDPRAMMIGMMGGMMGGMGGGMGGMMGGMGGMMGGMGGMGGGMRSVPPTDLPSAVLKAGQTRHLPTRLVSVSRPDAEMGAAYPRKGERLRIVGDIADVNHDASVQKALRRLTADKAPTAVSQLVMWRVAAGLGWDTIAQLSEKWANDFEVTLARHFADSLDQLPKGESGNILIELETEGESAAADAAELKKAIDGATLLGLVARVGPIPEQPAGPAVACRIRLRSESDADVRLASSNASAQDWLPFGKFTVPASRKDGKIDVWRFADGLAEGVLSRLVRAQVIKGSGNTQKGKLIYQIKIENASPLILNGIAVVGAANKKESRTPQVLSMFSVSPRRSLTVPASEEMVRSLGLKKGVKVVALDLSGL